jgi:hypothetical protein
MGKAAILNPKLPTIQASYRDPADHQRPKLRYACIVEYRAWVHVIPLGVRMWDPILIRDARNVFCRALMDMGDEFYSAEAEAKAAVRKPGSSIVINGMRHVGAGADGKRFRAVGVDVGRTRVVAVVPAVQREICIELSDV